MSPESEDDFDQDAGEDDGSFFAFSFFFWRGDVGGFF